MATRSRDLVSRRREPSVVSTVPRDLTPRQGFTGHPLGSVKRHLASSSCERDTYLKPYGQGGGSNGSESLPPVTVATLTLPHRNLSDSADEGIVPKLENQGSNLNRRAQNPSCCQLHHSPVSWGGRIRTLVCWIKASGPAARRHPKEKTPSISREGPSWVAENRTQSTAFRTQDAATNNSTQRQPNIAT